MKITEVKIYPLRNRRGNDYTRNTNEDDNHRLKAYVSCILESKLDSSEISQGVPMLLAIKHLRIVEGNNGLFVSMPSKRKKDGVYEDIFHPLNKETRKYIEQEILEKYHQETLEEE
jgi:stage V sporulation protein G